MAVRPRRLPPGHVRAPRRIRHPDERGRLAGRESDIGHGRDYTAGPLRVTLNTMPLAYDVATTDPRPRRPSWVAPILAAIAAFALLLVGAFAWFATHARTSQTVGRAPADTFSLAGNVWLKNSADVLNLDGSRCEGTGSHSDIRQGAQVKVTDPSGAQMGAAGLQQGYMVGEGFGRICVFAFTIDGVPSGRASYSVAVANRAPTVHSEDEAHGGADIILG